MVLAAAEATTGMASVTSAISSWISLAGTMLSTITSNAVLCFCFAAGFVGVAIGIVKKLRH